MLTTNQEVILQDELFRVVGINGNKVELVKIGNKKEVMDFVLRSGHATAVKLNTTLEIKNRIAKASDWLSREVLTLTNKKET